MVTNKEVQGYARVLFGKTRRAILTLLLNRPDDSFYLREIVRLTGTGLDAAQRELKLLAEVGIIRRTKRGNQVYYQASRIAPIYHELKNILAPSPIKVDKASPEEVSRRFNVSQDRLVEFCRRNNIRKLSLFGSVLRTDYRPDSDIDMLAEFEEGKTPGFAIIRTEDELSQLAGRKVDLRTAKDLSRYFRDQVVKEAKALYG